MGTRGPSPLTHTTSYAGTRAFMRHRARVALYNHCCGRSFKPHAGVFGEVLLPWGKGLIDSNVSSIFGNLSIDLNRSKSLKKTVL